MKRTRKPKLTKAARLLLEPTTRATLDRLRALDQAADLRALNDLAQRLAGRTMHPARRWPARRDPVRLAWRYLRRRRPGVWYRGGSHVARLDFGAGLAVADGWEQGQPVSCYLINDASPGATN